MRGGMESRGVGEPARGRGEGITVEGIWLPLIEQTMQSNQKKRKEKKRGSYYIMFCFVFLFLNILIPCNDYW